MENKTEKQKQFLELRAKGNSYDKIAKKLGVSKGTLINWGKELKVELANQCAFEKDLLMEQYEITRQHQLISKGILLCKVRRELNKRDFSDVPTEKLFNMELKLLDDIDQSNLDTQFTIVHQGLIPIDTRSFEQVHG